jgi:hypothetical protein
MYMAGSRDGIGGNVQRTSGQDTGLWATCESKMRGGPIQFRVMGFQPVGAKDDIVGTDRRDIKFGVFFMVMVVRGLDADGLDCSMSDRASFVQGSVNVFDR